jgi:Homeobox KN domain
MYPNKSLLLHSAWKAPAQVRAVELEKQTSVICEEETCQKRRLEKLQKWFITYLNHPYLIEEEKKDLIKDTGLKMSKLGFTYIIVKYFISECSPLALFPSSILLRPSRPDLELVHQCTSPPALRYD